MTTFYERRYYCAAYLLYVRSVLSNKIRPHPYICSQHVIWAIADDYHIAIATVTVQPRGDSSGHVCQEPLSQHGYIDLIGHSKVDREFSCPFVVWLEVRIVYRFLVIETMTCAVSWHSYCNFLGIANLKPVLSGILRVRVAIWYEMFVGQQPTPSKSHWTQCRIDVGLLKIQFPGTSNAENSKYDTILLYYYIIILVLLY